MPEFSVYNTGLGLLVETCSLDEIILRSIEKALEITKGNQSQAAKLLGVSRTFIWRKLKNM